MGVVLSIEGLLYFSQGHNPHLTGVIQLPFYGIVASTI